MTRDRPKIGIGARIGKAAARLGARFTMLLFPLFDLVVPKDRRLVVFSQAKGVFSDNSRALFEHMVASEGPFRPVWLASSGRQKAVIEATCPGAVVALRWSRRGYLLALRAKTVVVSHGLTEFLPYSAASRRKFIVMLWHATDFKSIALLNNNWTEKEKYVHATAVAAYYSLIVASSQIDRHAKAVCNGVPAARVVVTGLPRTDKLFHAPGATTMPDAIARVMPAKLILYAPTFRENDAVTDFFPFADFDAVALNTVLRSIDAYILLRPHRNDVANRRRMEEWSNAGLDRLMLATSDLIPDVADILASIDLVLTDYSSIFIDLLLIDRPAIFIPYDLQDYERIRGLLYNYDAMTPGPKVFNQHDFLAALRSGTEGAPEFADHRALVRAMFHQYADGQSAARVDAHIRQLVFG